MKRTSLWEISERVKGTRRAVVARWDFVVAVRVGAVAWEGGGGRGTRDWYRPTRAKGRMVVRRRG